MFGLIPGTVGGQFIVGGGGAADLYASTILLASPLAYYRLNEASTGAGLIDDSGNSNDGTFFGASIIPVSGIPGAGSNLALTLASNIENPYAIMTSGLLNCASAATPRSIECWYRGTEDIGPLVTGRHSAGNPITALYIGNAGIGTVAGTPKFLVRDDGGSGLTEITGSGAGTILVNDDAWHQIVAVLGGGGATKGMQLYIDGVVAASNTHTKGGVTTITRDWIGRDFNTDGGSPHGNLDGVIDEVSIYDYALSASRILAHYNAGI